MPSAWRRSRRTRLPLTKGLLYLVALGALATVAFDSGARTEGEVLATANWASDGGKVEVGPAQHRRLAGLAHVLFGAADYLSPTIGVSSMIIVIFCVLSTEMFFEMLSHMTHDTPFSELITAIENEMMIVGFMAFVLKVILNLTTFNNDWLLGLEYADLVVPIVTFIRCFIGVGFIYMSINVCDHWGRSYHMHHLQVMDSYLDRSHHFWERGFMSWMPISWANGTMEFRIFHHIFCEHFMIQRSAFAFDEYVHRIFEKFLLRIIGMHEVDWFLICSVCVLNFLRVTYSVDIHECLKDSPRYCKYDYYYCQCHKVSAMEDFIICGFTILGFTIVLAIVSRVYELRLMAVRGVHTSDDYALYLDSAEKEAQKQVVSDRKRFNAETLKLAVSRMKEKAEEEKAIEENAWLSILLDTPHHILRVGVHLLSLCSKALHLERADSFRGSGKGGSGKGGNGKPSLTRKGSIIVEDFEDLPDDEDDDAQGGNEAPHSPSAAPSSPAPTAFFKLQPQGAKASSSSGDIDGNDSTSTTLHGDITSMGRSTAGQTFESLGSNLNNKRDNSASLDRPPLDNIFLFHSPQLYFDAVAVTMMPISFYLALWVTHFVSSAYEIKTKGSVVMWQLVSLAPGFFGVLFYAYAVRVASLLSAVTQIDHDAVEEILEQTESALALQQEMRRKILAKLEEIGDPRVELQALFRSIDDNGSGLLSRKEFQLFLNELQITFSRRKWAQIYAEIDKDNSNEIDYDELFLFIFPDSNEAVRMERRRLRDIEKKVGLKAKRIINRHKSNEDATLKSEEGAAQGGFLTRTISSVKKAVSLPSSKTSSSRVTHLVLTTLAEGASNENSTTHQSSAGQDGRRGGVAKNRTLEEGGGSTDSADDFKVVRAFVKAKPGGSSEGGGEGRGWNTAKSKP